MFVLQRRSRFSTSMCYTGRRDVQPPTFLCRTFLDSLHNPTTGGLTPPTHHHPSPRVIYRLYIFIHKCKKWFLCRGRRRKRGEQQLEWVISARDLWLRTWHFCGTMSTIKTMKEIFDNCWCWWCFSLLWLHPHPLSLPHLCQAFSSADLKLRGMMIFGPDFSSCSSAASVFNSSPPPFSSGFRRHVWRDCSHILNSVCFSFSGLHR